MKAREIMTAPAITTGPDTPLVDIVDLMLSNRISAVPVVDGSGTAIGIVSEGDLMRCKDLGTLSGKSWWLRVLGGKVMLAEDFIKAHATTASELMTTGVITIGEDTLLPEIARLLENNRIKRVPVVADGKVVGIVSRANLLQALSLEQAGSPPPPSGGDRELRDCVMDTLAHEKWADISHLNLVVRNGTVFLWGEVNSPAQRKALVIAAGEVPGVKEVVDNTRTFQTIF